MQQRTPYDGQPYYCDVCGAGWNEYGACELPGCRLEGEADAVARQKEREEWSPGVRKAMDHFHAKDAELKAKSKSQET